MINQHELVKFDISLILHQLFHNVSFRRQYITLQDMQHLFICIWLSLFFFCRALVCKGFYVNTDWTTIIYRCNWLILGGDLWEIKHIFIWFFFSISKYNDFFHHIVFELCLLLRYIAIKIFLNHKSSSSA